MADSINKTTQMQIDTSRRRLSRDLRDIYVRESASERAISANAKAQKNGSIQSKKSFK